MKYLKKVALAFCLLGTSTLPALAGVVVYSPWTNGYVSSPFNLSAWANWCGSQSVVSTGYSLDSSTSTTTFQSQTINAPVSVAAGGHTLHVKAWGSGGGVCVTDVPIIVSAGAMVPTNATSVSSIQALDNWTGVHDTGTQGGSSGSMSITSSPSLSGAARQLATSTWNYGGERYSVSFGDEQSKQNFLLDTWVYVANPSTGISNLEFDLNQVMSNGQTVIFGFQCDTWSGTWDYSANKNGSDQWVHSSAPCNVRNWSTNAWHHVQIAYSRDDSGNIAYKTVWLDGAQQAINATALGAFELGWSPVLLVNVQVDGATSGASSSLVYVDELTVYSW
jgi:hypothetical protein